MPVNDLQITGRGASLVSHDRSRWRRRHQRHRRHGAPAGPGLDLPASLEGLTVLDIGAWDGFFSFECERRGASRVVAADYYSWHGPGWGTKAGFQLAREALGSRVEDVDIDVMDLSPERVGTFDVVLFLGVLYHLRHPLSRARARGFRNRSSADPRNRRRHGRVPAASHGFLSGPRTEWRSDQLVGSERSGGSRNVDERGLSAGSNHEATAGRSVPRRSCRLPSPASKELRDAGLSSGPRRVPRRKPAHRFRNQREIKKPGASKRHRP